MGKSMPNSSKNEKKSYKEWENQHNKEQLDKLYKAVEAKMRDSSSEVDVNKIVEEVLSDGGIDD